MIEYLALLICYFFLSRFFRSAARITFSFNLIWVHIFLSHLVSPPPPPVSVCNELSLCLRTYLLWQITCILFACKQICNLLSFASLFLSLQRTMASHLRRRIKKILSLHLCTSRGQWDHFLFFFFTRPVSSDHHLHPHSHPCALANLTSLILDHIDFVSASWSSSSLFPSPFFFFFFFFSSNVRR